jgi:regulator of PEP synthase PpsR (kinase-PPPase family)
MIDKKIQHVFFISDSTGITIESLGQSLFTQFPDIEFEKKVFPFVSNQSEAQRVISFIRDATENNQIPPIVFTSLADKALKNLFIVNGINVLDIFSTYIPAMESHLGTSASQAVGETHGVGSPSAYIQRINALNFTLNHDDGMKIIDMEHANIILTGVSRTGKTPTSLYLSMHYNLKVANYPLTDSDFESPTLPQAIAEFQDRVFGLTISPQQLCRIREERKPNSQYASYKQCEYEVSKAMMLFDSCRLPYLDTSSISIEEIATTIIQRMNLKIHGKW